MHREPDVGFDSGSPGCPGLKAGAKSLSHPGCLPHRILCKVQEVRQKGDSRLKPRPLTGFCLLRWPEVVSQKALRVLWGGAARCPAGSLLACLGAPERRGSHGLL